jgi:glycosyltransferase involved in cell wall biosynthesis
MRIALVVTEYVTEANYAGGLANYTYRVAIALKKLGHEPMIFVTANQDETIYHDDILIIRVLTRSPRVLSLSLKIVTELLHILIRIWSKTFKTLNLLIPFISQENWLYQRIYSLVKIYSFLVESRFFLEAAISMRHALFLKNKECKIDLIQYTHLAGIGCLRLSIPTVVRLSSYRDLWIPYNFQFSKPLEKLLEDIALKRADQVIAPSHWVADYVTKKLKIPVKVIESPFIPPTEAEDSSILESTINPQETYSLYFGSLAEWKGVFVLMDAVKIFLDNHQNYSFVFIGRDLTWKDGVAASDYIYQNLKDYGNRVKVLGSLRHPQLFPIIRRSNFVVLPSLAENFPNACLEAMWLKKVVIGTLGRSFDQLITHSENGFLCEPGDINSLVKTMDYAASLSDSDRLVMGEKAHYRIKELSPDKVVTELLQVYESLISV